MGGATTLIDSDLEARGYATIRWQKEETKMKTPVMSSGAGSKDNNDHNNDDDPLLYLSQHDSGNGIDKDGELSSSVLQEDSEGHDDDNEENYERRLAW